MMLKALRRRKTDDTIMHWIEPFLSYRYINASLDSDDLTIPFILVLAVLSPILWCLVVDSFLKALKSLNALVMQMMMSLW